VRTLAFGLPAGIEPSDLVFISKYVAIIAVVFAVIGILLLKRFAGRSISFMVAIVVAVFVLERVPQPAAQAIDATPALSQG